ncbi:hypothetical protein BC629DRAFT_1597034 [Irpex lacteus]|nr:hypothetical protein BC629DRAFT_1597034 [Irpex lacteus]
MARDKESSRTPRRSWSPRRSRSRSRARTPYESGGNPNTDRGRSRDRVPVPPSPRSDSSMSSSSDGRSRSRARSTSIEAESNSSRKRRRDSPSPSRGEEEPTWTFVRGIGIVHTEDCEICQDFLDHRADHLADPSFQTAIANERRILAHHAPSRQRRSEAIDRESSRLKAEVRQLQDDLDDLTRKYDRARDKSDDLEHELARVKGQRNRAEEERDKHKTGEEGWRAEAARLQKTVEYYEQKTELMRRQLLVHKRERTPGKESNKLVDAPEAQLRRDVNLFEINRDIYGEEDDDEDDYFEPTTKRGRRKQRERQRELDKEDKEKEKAAQAATMDVDVEQSAENREATPKPSEETPSLESRLPLDDRITAAEAAPEEANAGPLEDRISSVPVVSGPRPPMSGPIPRWYSPRGGRDPNAFIPNEEARGSLIPMFDRLGNRIIIAGPHVGIRIYRGIVINCQEPLPAEPPDVTKINPVTGVNWVLPDLEAYPHGLPGYPSHWPVGRMTAPERYGWIVGTGTTRVNATGPDRAPLPTPNYRVMEIHDHSREQLYWLPNNPDMGTVSERPWKWPRNAAEVRRLREVAGEPCNLLALNFWGRYVDYCNKVEKSQRSEAEREATASTPPRPIWAPVKVISSNVRDKKRRKKDERLRRAHGTPATRSNHPQPTTPVAQATTNVAQRVFGSNIPVQTAPPEGQSHAPYQPLNMMRINAPATPVALGPQGPATEVTNTSEPVAADTTLSSTAAPTDNTVDSAQDADVPMKDSSTSLPAPVSLSGPSQGPEFLTAAEALADNGIPFLGDQYAPTDDRVMNWVDMMNECTHLSLPGIRRDIATYRVLNVAAVRGMLAIARLGPYDGSATLTAGFIRHVAEFLQNRTLTAEQVLTAPPLDRPATIMNLNSYLDDVAHLQVDHPIDDGADGDIITAIRDWILEIKPPLDVGSATQFPNLPSSTS